MPSAADAAGTILRVDPAFDSLVPPDARVERLADGFLFTEGPVWVRRGESEPHLLFSDIPANAIKKWSPDGGVSGFMSPVFEGDPGECDQVGSNGLLIDDEGRLIMCEHGNRRVSRLEPDGSITVLADRYDGKRLNSPNDGVFHSNGCLYFTDPPYGLAGLDDDPTKELEFNGIFRLRPGGRPSCLSATRPGRTGSACRPTNTRSMWRILTGTRKSGSPTICWKTARSARVGYSSTCTPRTHPERPMGWRSTATVTCSPPVQAASG